jgi:hypothetical protein
MRCLWRSRAGTSHHGRLGRTTVGMAPMRRQARLLAWMRDEYQHLRGHMRKNESLFRLILTALLALAFGLDRDVRCTHVKRDNTETRP